MKDERQAFAERLRAKLAGARVSDKPVELAALIARHGGQVSPQGISYWLNGKTMPRQRNLRALAKLLRVDPAWLQYGDADGRRVGERRGEPIIGALDQHAIDAFIALPEERRELVRKLIEELSRDDGRKRHN